MKKLIVTALVILGCGAAYALPLGNPTEASLLNGGVFFSESSCGNNDSCCDPCFCWFDAWSLRVGYYGDFVFNRNLKLRGEGFGQGEAIQTTEIFTNAGYLALNICNKLDVFGTLGATRISIITDDISWSILGNTQGELDWESYFSWSAGARATLIEWGCFAVGLEGQYFQTTPELSKYLSTEDGRYNYFTDESKMRYREWQVGLGASYTLSTFCPILSIVPYAGAKCGWVRFHTNSFEFNRAGNDELLTIFNMQANKLWGYAIGISATFGDCIGVTVEGRWADEKALYVNGQFRF